MSKPTHKELYPLFPHARRKGDPDMRVPDGPGLRKMVQDFNKIFDSGKPFIVTADHKDDRAVGRATHVFIDDARGPGKERLMVQVEFPEQTPNEKLGKDLVDARVYDAISAEWNVSKTGGEYNYELTGASLTPIPRIAKTYAAGKRTDAEQSKPSEHMSAFEASADTSNTFPEKSMSDAATDNAAAPMEGVETTTTTEVKADAMEGRLQKPTEALGQTNPLGDGIASGQNFTISAADYQAMQNEMANLRAAHNKFQEQQAAADAAKQAEADASKQAKAQRIVNRFGQLKDTAWKQMVRQYASADVRECVEPALAKLEEGNGDLDTAAYITICASMDTYEAQEKAEKEKAEKERIRREAIEEAQRQQQGAFQMSFQQMRADAAQMHAEAQARMASQLGTSVNQPTTAPQKQEPQKMDLDQTTTTTTTTVAASADTTQPQQQQPVDEWFHHFGVSSDAVDGVIEMRASSDFAPVTRAMQTGLQPTYRPTHENPELVRYVAQAFAQNGLDFVGAMKATMDACRDQSTSLIADPAIHNNQGQRLIVKLY